MMVKSTTAVPNRPSHGVTRLLEAIQQTGDFPAMAQTVDAISSMTSTDLTSAIALADAILQDYGLTQKLLRMVNTLGYGQYAEVTTVTRAVMLMGFDRVRSVATSLIIFEHFRKHAQGAPLIELLSRSFCSAVVSRNLAQATGATDPEEAFIGALYHRLGQVLVAFYAPHYFAAIEETPAHERNKKVVQLFGVGFDEIGSTIAHELHLPDRIRQAMTPSRAVSGRRVGGDLGRLTCLAAVSNSLTDIMLAEGDVEARRAEMAKLLASVAADVTFSGALAPLLTNVAKEVAQSAGSFKLKLQGTRLMVNLRQFDDSRPAGSGAGKLPGDAVAPEDDFDRRDTTAASAEAALSKGLSEVTALLTGDYAFDDVLRIVLETIYQALGVRQARVLFLLKDPAKPKLSFRFGFGLTPDESALWNGVSVAGVSDFLGQAMQQNKDIVIRNARGPSVAQALPAWLVRQGLLDRYVVLLPLTVEQRPVGLFYIDGRKGAHDILAPDVVNNLKLLRDQVVVAIRRRTGRNTSAKP